MLSGIRTGKKKKRKTADGEASPSDRAVAPPVAKRPASGDNLSVAEQLRLELASGKVPTAGSGKTSTKAELIPFDRLQQEGRIENDSSPTKSDQDVVILTGSAAATTSSRPDYRPEDFRSGSRKGKLKRSSVDVAGTTKEQAGMTIQDMVREERQSRQSMDEVYARNVARVGSRYKGTDFQASSVTGADEEDAVDMTMFSQQKLTSVASQQKERSRQLAQHDKEQSITSRCWWWMESSSFRKHMLIALGNHVSLVMTPSHLALFPGEQLYLVPIKHAESLVACEDDVWNELYRFQSSLRAMYAKHDKQVVFCETVMPSTKGLWQTKLDCIPVPKRDAANAPMYFKSALTELAEDWGTHTKLLSTKDKGLRRTIPKKFPYFYVEWEENAGFAQIIESSSFPKDLGPDTLAGLMQMDPIRFRRKQTQSSDEERKMVLNFIGKWKTFDWTLDLD